MNFSEWLFGLFDGLGPEWVVFCIFLLFFIDAVLFPTLPEVFIIMGYEQNPTAVFGCELLAAAILAELAGIFLLYFVVKKIRVPNRVAKVAQKYIDFLMISDEKALLMNRVAPMIPFAGAFIALIDKWKPVKCAFWIVLGCVLKYGAILMMSDFFLSYFTDGMAQRVMLAFVLLIIVLSFVAAYFKKRRSGLEDRG